MSFTGGPPPQRPIPFQPRLTVNAGFDPVKNLRYVVFVDAGYLRPIVAQYIKADLRDTALNGPEIVRWSDGLWNARLMRVYVYDGAWPADHPRHGEQAVELEALAETEGIRLRLGTLRQRPGKGGGFQQKGVDTLIVLDMLQMAQEDAYDVAVLIAGDADFVEVVDAVQRIGRQVFVARHETPGLSTELRQAADSFAPMNARDFVRFGVTRTREDTRHDRSGAHGRRVAEPVRGGGR